MRTIGLIVLGFVALAVLRLGLQVLIVTAGVAFLWALFRDPVRVFATAVGCAFLAFLLAQPPVVKLLILLVLLLTHQWSL